MIALITDFGDSAYVGAVKGVIASLCPQAKVVDVTHGIRKFDVRHAAYELSAVEEYFPEGTIFCVVVDPGVGTERRGVIVEAGGKLYVGPDNGAFSLVRGVERIYEIRAVPKSATFHGRDVFAPTCARLECGASPRELGVEAKDLTKLAFREVSVEKGSVAGEVWIIDNFGNAITNIREEDLRKAGIGIGDSLALRIKRRARRTRMLRSYGFAKEGELICVVGSAGYLEMAVNRGSAAKALGLKGGEEVSIKK